MEVAQLVARLTLQDGFTAPLAKVESTVGRMGGTLGKLGGAVEHAGSQLKNLITGPVGLLGLGVGLFTVTGAIEKGITKAVDFGAEVRRLIALTGESAQSMSALAAGFEHFGIGADSAQRSIGFLEKNVGLLAAHGGIADFEKTFGLTLTDTNGKIKSANELILTSADYFNNKLIPSTEKAAALSKLYGRSWQELIPVLSAGRDGLQAAEEEAAKLGLTLTGDNLKDLIKLRDATREWDTALGGLEMQIGLALVPEITKLARGLTSFVTDHRTDIVAFFKNAAAAAEHLGSIIGSAFGTLSSAWNAIPPEVRDLIVKGIVADRTIKFLFGFDPIKAIGGALFGNSGFLSRGSSPANPLFVSGGGLGPGSTGNKILDIASKVILVGIVAEAANELQKALGLDYLSNRDKNLPLDQLQWPFGPKNTPDWSVGPWQHLLGGDSGLPPLPNPLAPGIASAKAVVDARLPAGMADDIREANRIAVQSTQVITGTIDESGNYVAAAINGLPAKLRSIINLPVAAILKGIQERSAARFGGHGLGSAAVDATFQRDLLRAARTTANSSETQAQKIADLKKLQADLLANGTQGDKNTAAKIAGIITAIQHMKPPINNITVPPDGAAAKLAGIVASLIGRNPDKTSPDQGSLIGRNPDKSSPDPSIAKLVDTLGPNPDKTISSAVVAAIRNIFVPGVKLDPSQVIDLRRGNLIGRNPDKNVPGSLIGRNPDKAVDATFQSALLRAAKATQRSSETNAQKISDLKRLQQDLISNGTAGDRRTAAKIGTLISAVGAQKPPHVTVNVTVPVSVSTRDIVIKTLRNGRFGSSVGVG